MAASTGPPQSKSLLGRHRLLAPASGIRVSPLCLGAMTFGDKQTARYGEVTKATAFEILDKFYNAGGNFIDTANAYQMGVSEQWLGEWMASRNNREDIVLATKYSGINTRDTKDASHYIMSNWGGNGTKSMRASIEGSLKRLQTSYVDLFYCHFIDYTTPVIDIIREMNELASAGKVTTLGVSDWPAWAFAKANTWAIDHGLRQFVIYQGLYNASVRDMEREIIPACREFGMSLAIWGAMGQGAFQTRAAYQEREVNNPGRKFRGASARDKHVSAALEDLAKTKGFSLQQVAVAYVMAKFPYIYPIVGCRTVEQIQGSIDSLSIGLTDEDIGKIEAASDFDPGFPHTMLSGSYFDGSAPRNATRPDDIWLTYQTGSYDFIQPESPIAVKGVKAQNGA